MHRRSWLVAALLGVPLAIAGLAYGHSLAKNEAEKPKTQGYICPVTGEELPCPNCCPLNQEK